MLVRDEGDVWLIWAVAFLYGVSFVEPPAAANGLLKELLPEDLLVDANGSLATIKEGFRLFGPLVGAAIFATAGGWLVAVDDATSFAVAAALIATIKVEATSAAAQEQLPDEVEAGLRYLVGDRVLRNVLIGLGASRTWSSASSSRRSTLCSRPSTRSRRSPASSSPSRASVRSSAA